MLKLMRIELLYMIRFVLLIRCPQKLIAEHSRKQHRFLKLEASLTEIGRVYIQEQNMSVLMVMDN